MRPHRAIVIAVSLASIIGLFAVLVLGRSAPIELKVVGVEPAGIIDDTGAEMSLVTVCVRNLDSVSIEFQQNRKSLDIKVGDRWVESGDSLAVGFLAPHAKHEVLLLIPTQAKAVRAHLSYQTQNLKWRLWSYLGPVGPQFARKFPKIANRLLPQGPSMPRPPVWKTNTVEFGIPGKAVQELRGARSVSTASGLAQCS